MKMLSKRDTKKRFRATSISLARSTIAFSEVVLVEQNVCFIIQIDFLLLIFYDNNNNNNNNNNNKSVYSVHSFHVVYFSFRK